MTKKVKFIIETADGKPVTEFFSKNATKALNKQGKGTRDKVFIEEDGFGKAFVGDYEVKGLKDEPEEPDQTCPQGQHWDEAQNKCVDDVPEPGKCPDGQHWDNLQQKCVPDTTDHTCPQGQHWDDAQGKCVPDVVTPPTGNAKYNSNVQGKWNDGKKRFVTDREGDVGPDGYGFTVNAGGGGGVDVDGQGVATIKPQTKGNRRLYVAACNYNALIRGQFRFDDAKNDNASIKGRSRHQFGDEVNKDAKPEEKQGGVGFHFSIAEQLAGTQLEIVHGTEGPKKDTPLPKKLVLKQWYPFEVSYKDGKPGEIDCEAKLDFGQGLVSVHKRSISAPAQFFNKAQFDSWSQFWLRDNHEGPLSWKDIELVPI
jgi:hypothetical protein